MSVDGAIDRSSIRDIEYSKEDDEAIERYIKDNMTTAWHGLGTCAMRAKESQGVVDHQLNVHDVSGLKLCGTFLRSFLIHHRRYIKRALVQA